MNRHRNTQAEGLVQPEGVNAGSAKSTVESMEGAPQTRPVEELTRGGAVSAADDQVQYAPGRTQIVDAPFGDRDPAGPSLEQSEEERQVHRR
jgi:hypothetical protein